MALQFDKRLWGHAHCWLEKCGGWSCGEERRHWARDWQEGEAVQFLYTGPTGSHKPKQDETLGPTSSPRE